MQLIERDRANNFPRTQNRRPRGRNETQAGFGHPLLSKLAVPQRDQRLLEKPGIVRALDASDGEVGEVRLQTDCREWRLDLHIPPIVVFDQFLDEESWPIALDFYDDSAVEAVDPAVGHLETGCPCPDAPCAFESAGYFLASRAAAAESDTAQRDM